MSGIDSGNIRDISKSAYPRIDLKLYITRQEELTRTLAEINNRPPYGPRGSRLDLPSTLVPVPFRCCTSAFPSFTILSIFIENILYAVQLYSHRPHHAQSAMRRSRQSCADCLSFPAGPFRPFAATVRRNCCCLCVAATTRS